MKILIISNSLWNLYNFRRNLIIKLNNNKDNNIYIVCEKSLDIQDNININKNNINFINFNSNSLNFFYNLTLFIKIFSLILKIKPDIVLSFTIKPNIFSSLICKFLKIKNIVNITGLGTVFLQNKIKFKIFKYIYKFALSKSSLIYFQNNFDYLFFNKNNIISYKNKYKIIPGSGIDLDKFDFHKYEQKKTINFFFISRLILEKGIFELFDSIKIIKKKYNHVFFTIVGNIDSKNKSSIDPQILSNMQKLNLIKYYKFTKDVRSKIKKSDCLILPSYREGTSRILLENAAMGKPAITTNVPGCNNVILDNYNGLLCKPKDSNSLTQAIEKFINLDFKNKELFGINSRKYIENNFDEKYVINSYINDINKISEFRQT